MKKALITWITWQDGAYLAEFLLSKWYEVHGIKRRSSIIKTDRIDHLYHPDNELGTHFITYYSDLTDATSLIRIVSEVRPDEIYNLWAQSHVQVSFDVPEYTANSDAIWVLRILECMRALWIQKTCRFYQASTSELFWWNWVNPFNEGWYTEQSPFYPRSPYGVAKLYAYWITKNYREAYGMHASNGILFNHESPIRWETFVTRKITRAVAKISLWLQKEILLWNLDAKRDWWHAKDYIEAMWLILQKDLSDDYIISSWEAHTVREFVELSFKEVGISIMWKWGGVDELWIDKKTGNILVRIDEKYFRPSEVDYLLWNNFFAKKELNWNLKYSFQQLVADMVKSDVALFKKDK